ELRAEAEAFTVRDALDPGLRDGRAWRSVERRIDLDAVEEAGEVTKRVEAPRPRPRIDDPVPVLVVPACNAHANLRELPDPTPSCHASTRPCSRAATVPPVAAGRGLHHRMDQGMLR